MQDLNRQHEAEDDSFTIDDFGNLVNTKNITPAYGGKFECNYLDNEGVRHKRLHTVYVHGIQEEISQGHVYIVIGVICLLVVSICLAVVFCCYCCKKSKSRKKKEVRDKGGSQMVESDSKPIEKITEVPGFHQKNGSQMLAYWGNLRHFGGLFGISASLKSHKSLKIPLPMTQPNSHF